jgi:hypothetical protein
MSTGAVAETLIDPAADRRHRLADAEQRLRAAHAGLEQATAEVQFLRAAEAAETRPQPPGPADRLDERLARDRPAPRQDPPPLTAADWPTCADPNRLLAHVAGTVSDRKLRLLTVAAARLVWDAITPEMREAMEMAEGLADGLATAEELQWYRDRLYPYMIGNSPPAARRWRLGGPDAATFLLMFATTYRADMIRRLPNGGAWMSGSAAFADRVAPLVRDIVGDPFLPATFDPAWRTADVIGIAEAAYEGRAFDRLPILADALQDAGCQDAATLSHCRSGSPHHRGCWAVDLILDRA